MKSFIQEKLSDIVDICKRRSVSRLFLFGSATREETSGVSNDMDFLVEFHPLPPAEYADSYFGLLEDLESLFSLPVDLVELRAVRNPYFREAVEETRILLYDAA